VIFLSWPATDVYVTGYALPEPVGVSATLTYTLAGGNFSVDYVAIVQVMATLPVSSTFVSATPSQGTCSESGGVVTCTAELAKHSGGMLPGAYSQLNITIVTTAPPVTGTVQCAVTIVTGYDPDTSDNDVTIESTVQ
jgi:hypothetical protein